MENSKPIKINRIRYLASSFFVIIALINVVDSLINNRQTTSFDIVFLAVACLPLLIGKRLFILGYGILAAFLSFLILLAYLLVFNPQIDDGYLAVYFLGLLVFILAFASSLALVYVGTYSKEKGRFKLV